MNREYLLSKEKISKAVLKISTPSAISTLSSVIYSIINTIFIGRFVGFIGIAAISIYLPIQMLIVSIAALFASGCGSYISRMLGMKNRKNAEQALGTLTLITTTIAITISIIGILFATPIVKIFGANGNVCSDASTYARMMFIGTLFYPYCVAATSAIRSLGDTNYYMRGTIISVIANIIFDILFIVILRWGVLGAGLATALSKFINFAYIAYYFKAKSPLKIKFKYLRYNIPIIKKALPVGISTFINEFTGSMALMLLNKDLYYFGGNYVVAVYGIVYKLTSFIQRLVAGFSRGAQPLIGFNIGAKNFKRVSGTIKWGLIYSTLLASVGSIIMIIFSKYFVLLFTNNSNIITYGKNILIIALLGSPLLGLYFISITFFKAAGKAKEAIILSLFRRVIFFIPFLYLLPYGFNLGLIGIWITLPLSNILSAIISSIFLLKEFKTFNAINKLESSNSNLIYKN
ncbi:MAG: MATE family efflux transporter [Sarcina sp.]